MELVGSDLTLRQVAAREALGRVGRAVVPVLVASLGAPECRAGRARVELLGKLGESTAAPALIEALASDDLRWSASEALVKLGPSIVPLLVPVLEDPERGWLVVRVLSHPRRGSAGAGGVGDTATHRAPARGPSPAQAPSPQPLGAGELGGLPVRSRCD